MADASRLAAELDAVTAALDGAAPYPAMERLLKRRAILLGKLLEIEPTAGVQESLLRARECGERLAAKLSHDRTVVRERLGQLYHAKVLVEALRTPSGSSRVDYRG